MPKVKRRNNSSEDILDAAQQVAIEKGAAKVSLDSVAKQAGLTKGGVLYNFPNKNALINGMLERLMSVYTPKVAEYAANYSADANPTLRAVVHLVRELEDVNPNVFQAILTAAAHNQKLLEPWRVEKSKRYELINKEAADPDTASILWAASEGLLLLDILGMLPFAAAEKERLLQLIENKAQNNSTL